MKLKINADLVGIGTSITCAVHCAILPIFLSGLSVFGVNIIHNFWFESCMILIAFIVGLFSLRHGFIRHHGSSVPFFLFTGGMFLLLVKQFWHDYELVLLPFALFLIVFAHIFNFRFTRKFNKKKEQITENGCLYLTGG